MSAVGSWKLTMNTPFGVQTPLLEIKPDGKSGTLAGAGGTTALENLKLEGSQMSFSAKVSTPMGSFPVSFSAAAEGNNLKGTYETMMGKTEFTGVRQ